MIGHRYECVVQVLRGLLTAGIGDKDFISETYLLIFLSALSHCGRTEINKESSDFVLSSCVLGMSMELLLGVLITMCVFI